MTTDTILITFTDGTRRRVLCWPTPVPGLAITYGVHLYDDERPIDSNAADSYLVTHIPTGLVVSPFDSPSRPAAIAHAERLRNLANWTAMRPAARRCPHCDATARYRFCEGCFGLGVVAA